MKDFVLILVIILISFGVGMLLMHSCQEPQQVDYSPRIQELEKDTLRYGLQRDSLRTVIDSLLSIPDKIYQNTITIRDTIDKRIERDSTQSIVTFREGLQLWGTIPEGTDYPTYREFGYSAKYMQMGFGFKLQAREYETKIVPALQASVENYSFLYSSSQDLNQTKDLEIDGLRIELANEQSWFNSNWLWFGGGAVVTAILIYLAGLLGG